MRRLRQMLRAGDHIEKALNLVGITPEKVETYIGSPCRCRERKRKLNQVGEWAYRVLTGDTSPSDEEKAKATEELDKIVSEGETPNPGEPSK